MGVAFAKFVNLLITMFRACELADVLTGFGGTQKVWEYVFRLTRISIDHPPSVAMIFDDRFREFLAERSKRGEVVDIFAELENQRHPILTQVVEDYQANFKSIFNRKPGKFTDKKKWPSRSGWATTSWSAKDWGGKYAEHMNTNKGSSP